MKVLGPFNETAYEIVGDTGRCIARLSSDDRGGSFLFPRLSAVVQHFNSILLHDSFLVVYHPN